MGNLIFGNAGCEEEVVVCRVSASDDSVCRVITAALSHDELSLIIVFDEPPEVKVWDTVSKTVVLPRVLLSDLDNAWFTEFYVSEDACTSAAEENGLGHKLIVGGWEKTLVSLSRVTQLPTGTELGILFC